MNKLLVFYSYSNNTRELVKKINEKYHFDTIEIKTVEEYSSDYDKVVASEEKLVPLDYQPDILECNVDFDKYDEIILCTPVWWYSVASPVNTFLHKYNFKGKKIRVLATNGGWLGRTFENIESITGCELVNPIGVKFEDNRLVDIYEFEDWMNNLD